MGIEGGASFRVLTSRGGRRLRGTRWVLLLVATWVLASSQVFAFSPNYAPPPGAANPNVTQANISTTICKPGWTKTIRPPASYTNALKRKQMAERHLPGRPADYEEDHYIPLAVGGHPTDPKNLWPQPWPQAQLKDKLENVLNRAVCGGKLTLTQAQTCLRPDWVTCARKMHTPVP